MVLPSLRPRSVSHDVHHFVDIKNGTAFKNCGNLLKLTINGGWSWIFFSPRISLYSHLFSTVLILPLLWQAKSIFSCCNKKKRIEMELYSVTSELIRDASMEAMKHSDCAAPSVNETPWLIAFTFAIQRQKREGKGFETCRTRANWFWSEWWPGNSILAADYMRPFWEEATSPRQNQKRERESGVEPSARRSRDLCNWWIKSAPGSPSTSDCVFSS
jgi:hypothetical protein